MYIIIKDIKKQKTLSGPPKWDLSEMWQMTLNQTLFPCEIVLCVYDCICLVSQFINKTVQEETALLLLIAFII